jgi:ankyrin repeat protein
MSGCRLDDLVSDAIRAQGDTEDTDNNLALLGELVTSTQFTACLNDQENRILRALPVAADAHNFAAFRLLWQQLRPHARQYYYSNDVAENNNSYHCYCFLHPSPLHEAVEKGDVQVVAFLMLQEFDFNINQKDRHGNTPLVYAAASNQAEMTRILLQYGPNVNRGGEGDYNGSPLLVAVENNNTEIVRLLLQHGADPNLNTTRRQRRQFLRNNNIDIAIIHGNAEMLGLLLNHGARVDANNFNKSLHHLLNDNNNTTKSRREIKLAICRLLVEHANNDNKSGDDDANATTTTAAFLQSSMEIEINTTTTTGSSNNNNIEACEILLDAGMDKSSRLLYMAIQAENVSLCQLLVQKYRIDPFRKGNDQAIIMNGSSSSSSSSTGEREQAASPFLAAARLEKTDILNFFLEHWDERFSLSNRDGKNDDGDYPIHVVCCDARISLQAIQLVVNHRHHQAAVETVATVDGEQRLLPFQFAAMWDASLDVIYYLLQYCPDALHHHHHHVGNAAVAVVVNDPHSCLSSAKCNTTTKNGLSWSVEETRASSGKQGRKPPSRRPNKVCGPVKKKAKTNHY